MERNYLQKVREYFKEVMDDIRTNGLIQYPKPTMSVEEIAETMRPDKNPSPPGKGLVQFEDTIGLILKGEKSV